MTTLTLTDTDRWQAVLRRDRHYDGAFVTAVRTTRIYCRPSCPARHPHRENVTFYACAADAERDGFRPCKRCSPNTQAFEADVAQRACAYMDDHVDDRVTLNHLGTAVGLSPHHLQRVFKRVMGISPRQYAEARRVERLKAGLKNGGTVTDALYSAGYGSSSRLYERAPEQLGMTPAVYRKGGQGMNIHYTIADSPLGYLLVAATERGVCFVSMGDTPADLEAELRGEFPAAEPERDDDGLGEWVNAILDHLGGQQPHLELPLDVRATAFQRRVWQALQAIPIGETRTYRQIAASIGQPTAARAVGNACATNPVSLVIPCHRAVREDGSLGGYRWGLQRKAALLEQERKTQIKA